MSARLWRAIGPGILFAGAAVGNSHLVQSTRAGGEYGLALIGIVFIAHAMKYPAFRFGPYYAAATGNSLIEGYRQLGHRALWIVAASEAAVQAIIIAASAITTAAITVAVFEISIDPRILASIYIVLGFSILSIGGYPLLDRANRLFVAVLTVSTIAATVSILPRIDWNFSLAPLAGADYSDFAFIIALMGFMPAALNLSILHSLWTVAKSESAGARISVGDAVADMNIGYLGSAFLALCFLLMGAGVMFSAGIAPEGSAGTFARQLISLYTASLGEWSKYVVGISALCVMFTTLMTVLDGMPRMQVAIIRSLATGHQRLTQKIEALPLNHIMVAILGGAAIVILLFFMRNFREFIDFVTITAFIVAPIYAILNHAVVTGKHMPIELRPGTFMRWWSIFGIIFLTAVSATYLVWQLLH